MGRRIYLDEGAGRNRPMFNKVKKGDILLVPQLNELKQLLSEIGKNFIGMK